MCRGSFPKDARAGAVSHKGKSDMVGMNVFSTSFQVLVAGGGASPIFTDLVDGRKTQEILITIRVIGLYYVFRLSIGDLNSQMYMYITNLR